MHYVSGYREVLTEWNGMEIFIFIAILKGQINIFTNSIVVVSMYSKGHIEKTHQPVLQREESMLNYTRL